MLSPKSYIFLNEVLSYIKFSFDKQEIKTELLSHLSDKMDFYMDQGNPIEIAEQLSINDMGNPKEIGVELNKQHNPLLGWIWLITNTIVAFAAIVSGLVFRFVLSQTDFYEDLFLLTWESKKNNIVSLKAIRGYDSQGNILYEENY